MQPPGPLSSDHPSPPIPSMHDTSCRHSSLLCMLQVSFGVDLKVNVFEANIRLLGGLLSAHLLASDPELGLMQRPYEQQLLTQATGLGDRLLAAFDASPTGTPNMHGCLPSGYTSLIHLDWFTPCMTNIHTSPNTAVHQACKQSYCVQHARH